LKGLVSATSTSPLGSTYSQRGWSSPLANATTRVPGAACGVPGWPALGGCDVDCWNQPLLWLRQCRPWPGASRDWEPGHFSAGGECERQHREQRGRSNVVATLPLSRLVWVGRQPVGVATVRKPVVVAPQASRARSGASAAQCGQRGDEWGQAGATRGAKRPNTLKHIEWSPAFPHARSRHPRFVHTEPAGSEHRPTFPLRR